MMARRARAWAIALTALTTTILGACSSADPLSGDSPSASDAIVVGSQAYYSNEIIAEIYAQALENDGFKVDRQFLIGQRETYLPEIENGSIDLFPEYSGPLLQYWVDDATATGSDEVYAALKDAVPNGLQVLDQAPATDQDTYAVTKDFANQWSLVNISDLANVKTPLTLGANSEAENRPNGPDGLSKKYGIDVSFTPIEDSGGPLTIKALVDGDIQLAILYTANPALSDSGLVTLNDDAGLFLASHVVPVASTDLDAAAVSVINTVDAALTTDELIALNKQSTGEELPASDIAKAWLAAKGLS